MKVTGRKKSSNIEDRRPKARDPFKKKGVSYTDPSHTSRDVGSYGASVEYGTNEFHQRQKLKELQRAVDQKARKKALESGRGTKMNSRGK